MRFKKYIVFIIEQYYPSGGLSDISGSYDTIEEAREHILRAMDIVELEEDLFESSLCQIVDRDTWKVESSV